MGDFTVSCLDNETFQLTASYGAQDMHLRWFQNYLAPDVYVENISDRLTGFQIAGPAAPIVLASVASDPSQVPGMKFFDVRSLSIGLIDVLVQRVSYTGDIGFEIFCDPMEQKQLWSVLWEAGREHGMRPFGMRAMMSLRLDRFFGSWGREFSPDYTAKETGMDRFIDFSKDTDFIGREAAERERVSAGGRRLAAFRVDADDADVWGYEPLWLDGEVRGFCTSGGYSHWCDLSLALAFVPADLAVEGLKAEIEILGERRSAELITTPPFDPNDPNRLPL